MDRKLSPLTLRCLRRRQGCQASPGRKKQKVHQITHVASRLASPTQHRSNCLGRRQQDGKERHNQIARHSTRLLARTPSSSLNASRQGIAWETTHSQGRLTSAPTTKTSAQLKSSTLRRRHQLCSKNKPTRTRESRKRLWCSKVTLHLVWIAEFRLGFEQRVKILSATNEASQNSKANQEGSHCKARTEATASVGLQAVLQHKSRMDKLPHQPEIQVSPLAPNCYARASSLVCCGGAPHEHY